MTPDEEKRLAAVEAKLAKLEAALGTLAKMHEKIGQACKLHQAALERLAPMADSGNRRARADLN